MKWTLSVTAAALAVAAAASGCSSADGKFDTLLPGMSSAEVKRDMGEGPTRFHNVPNTEYTSWYWGTDYCALFENDKLVSKESRLGAYNGQTGGVKFSEARSPRCLAPGQLASTGEDSRTVDIAEARPVDLPETPSG